jgi:hypothetical protein
LRKEIINRNRERESERERERENNPRKIEQHVDQIMQLDLFSWKSLD